MMGYFYIQATSDFFCMVSGVVESRLVCEDSCQIKCFTFSQGADGVRGLKGSKGEKVSETDE